MTTIHKSFLVSLAAFVGISAVFQVINAALSNTLSAVASDPFIIVAWLFQGVAYNIVSSVTSLGASISGLIAGAPVALPSFIFALGIFLAPLAGAILAGFVAESKIDAFGGWILALVVCWLVYSIFFIVGTVTSSFQSFVNTASSLIGIVPSAYPLWYALPITAGWTVLTAVSWGMIPLAAQRETFY